MTWLHGLPHRSAGCGAIRGWSGVSVIATGLMIAVIGSGGGCSGAPKPAPVPGADDSALPAAEALIRTMIDATGGRAAYDRQRSRFSTGKVSLPKAKIRLTQTAWAQRPNKSYSLLESPVLGKIESGCDGSTVWERSDEGGPSLKRGAERAVLLRDADFDHWPNWEKYYKSATTVGADTVAGQMAWKIEMVPMEGPPETKWMDQTTGLLLKTSMKRPTQMGEIAVEIFYEDYREACGMKIAFRTREAAMAGMPEIYSLIDSVACNPSIPEDRFDLSAEIKALLVRAKAEAVLAESTEAANKRAPGEAMSNALANDYLSIIVLALNRSSEGMRARGVPTLRQYKLASTKVLASISADGFEMVPSTKGTAIVFGSTWADPLPNILGRRGDFPEMSFRNGRAEIQEQAGGDDLRISEGTEMQLRGATWVFREGKWKLAGPPK